MISLPSSELTTCPWRAESASRSPPECPQHGRIIGRLVHHGTILEMNIDSDRRRTAVNRRENELVARGGH